MWCFGVWFYVLVVVFCDSGLLVYCVLVVRC